MSTVVGTCTDCIVSLPVQPKTSLVFAVAVSEGMNGVIKQLGTFRGYYPSDNLSSQSLELTPGSTFTTGKVTAVCIKTNQPLQVTTMTGGVGMTFNVNSLMILDDSYDSLEITNPSGATVTAQVALYCTEPST
jgi:hypothetical protein